MSLTPKFELIDVYQSILTQAGVKVVSSTTEKSGTEQKLSIGLKLKAMIPVFGGGEAATEGTTAASSGKEITYEEIPANLELPQSISELLKRVNCNKWVVMENFHYLTDEVQQQFAFDLRAFQELGVKFVILGVWREQNRLAQFNGDLLDRTIEIPVEPWIEADFRRVADAGSVELNITFADNLVNQTIEASFSSIGVFQELLKHICTSAGVLNRGHLPRRIDDTEHLRSAIQVKTRDYGARHERALNAIAAGLISGGVKGEQLPLYLPYYLVRVIISHGFDGISTGARKQVLWEWIREVHHRGADVRNSDMTYLLGNLAKIQSVKAISPPIFAYDVQQRTLQVVDSTFYFFIKHADAAEVIDAIQNPLED